MRLYRKLRKHGAKTPSGPISGTSSATPKEETQNPPHSPARVDQTSPPTGTHKLEPATDVPAKQAAQTETTTPSNVSPSSSLEVESAAEKALSEAAESLKTKIQNCGMEASEFELKPIRGSYDMNSISHSLDLCLGAIMDKADVPVSNQNVVKTFAKEWGKKSIPFIEKGLDVAEVLSPGSVLFNSRM
jgi:hypothetical protein